MIIILIGYCGGPMSQPTEKKLDNYKLGLSNAEYQILVGKDGNSWCALMGSNLQEGVAGFGSTVKDALLDLANKL
jgi:hypothetical protein